MVCAREGFATDLLDYAPKPQANLSVSRREVSGAIFILLAIVARLVGLFFFGAAAIALIEQGRETHLSVEFVLTVLGTIAALLCLQASKAAHRRLVPAVPTARTERANVSVVHDDATEDCDSGVDA